MWCVSTALIVAYIATLASSLVLRFRPRNCRYNQIRRGGVVSCPSSVSKEDQVINVPLPLLQSLEQSYTVANVPMNIFKAKEPYKAQIKSVRSLIAQNTRTEICEVVVNHEGNIPCLEGQSLGVIPPGVNAKNGRPHTLRLYSLASTRYGDDMQGKTATLCVSRSLFVDESGNEIPDKKGICSNFLCDAKPGDEVLLTGPAGKVLLMPQQRPDVDIIMVATGTGVAPFRGFLRRLFVEKNTPAALAFTGLAWLFLGVPSTDSRLYHDEWQEIAQRHSDQFRVDYALSREQTNASGGRMYVQDSLELHSDEILARMSAGAHFYVCGLRAMLPGILSMFERVCSKKGLVWTDILKQWKDSGQWHVEVY